MVHICIKYYIQISQTMQNYHLKEHCKDVQKILEVKYVLWIINGKKKGKTI